MAETLWRIEELCTSGWQMISYDDKKLTRQQASKKLQEYLDEGYNPNRLRATPDV